MQLQVTEPFRGYSVDTTDDDARRQAARKLRVPQERIVIERTGGCVLARVSDETRRED